MSNLINIIVDDKGKVISTSTGLKINGVNYLSEKDTLAKLRSGDLEKDYPEIMESYIYDAKGKVLSKVPEEFCDDNEKAAIGKQVVQIGDFAGFKLSEKVEIMAEAEETKVDYKEIITKRKTK